MPNRYIKESVTTSESINKLTDAEEAFFYRLLVVCDDYGLMDARPAILKGRMYPLRDIALEGIDAHLQRLASVGLVSLYTVEGKRYLRVVNWHEHQQTRASVSKFPLPPGFTIIDKQLRADDSTCNQLQSSAINCNHVQADDSTCNHVIADAALERITNNENDIRFIPASVDTEGNGQGGLALEIQEEEQKAPYPPDFEEFWKAYPRKHPGKRAAFNAWISLMKLPPKERPTPAQLLAAAVAYADECERNRTPLEKIKHGKTFLSLKDRWYEGYCDVDVGPASADTFELPAWAPPMPADAAPAGKRWWFNLWNKEWECISLT